MPTSTHHRVMSRRAVTRLGLLLAGALVAWLLPPRWAHGITDDAGDRSVLGFVPLGIEHMLLGWDHVLFIGGVVLLAGEWRRAAKLITVFVIGHSLTLITATLAGWQVNPVLVDVVIVLSVVFVGGYGMVAGRPKRWDIFGGIVYLFGVGTIAAPLLAYQGSPRSAATSATSRSPREATAGSPSAPRPSPQPAAGTPASSSTDPTRTLRCLTSGTPSATATSSCCIPKTWPVRRSPRSLTSSPATRRSRGPCWPAPTRSRPPRSRRSPSSRP